MSHDNLSAPCHHLAKNYLQCRMDKGLMAKENLDTLGFAKPAVAPTDDEMDDMGRYVGNQKEIILGLSRFKR